jgi:choline dehydrogenase
VVRLRSVDPTVVPSIDRRLFSDPDGLDAEVLADGVELVRRLGATAAIAGLAAEVRPGPGLADGALPAWLRASASALYHPTGTCAMGVVCDAAGRVAGVDGLRVGDASLMPAIPRGNTHLTVLAAAERLADLIRRP